MFRTILPVLVGLLITASYALYDQAGQTSARLPALLHLMLGGALLVFGRSRWLRSIYAALTLGLSACALWFACGRFGLLPNGSPSFELFALAPWIVVAGSAALAAFAVWQAIRVRRISDVMVAKHLQSVTPSRLDVRPASLLLRRPEDRRIIRRQKALDNDGGKL